MPEKNHANERFAFFGINPEIADIGLWDWTLLKIKGIDSDQWEAIATTCALRRKYNLFINAMKFIPWHGTISLLVRLR